MVIQKSQAEKLLIINIKDNAKKQQLWDNIPVVHTLHQYANKKLCQIILLPFNYKNQTMTILFLTLSKYNGSLIIRYKVFVSKQVISQLQSCLYLYVGLMLIKKTKVFRLAILLPLKMSIHLATSTLTHSQVNIILFTSFQQMQMCNIKCIGL